MNRRHPHKYNQRGLGDLPDDIERETLDVVGYGGPGSNLELGPTQKRATASFVNRVAMTNRVYNVGDNSTVIIPANIYRKYLIMVNTGPNPIMISFGAGATVKNGVPIKPDGNYEPWIVPYSQVTAICDVSLSSSLIVVEGFYENL